MFYQYFQDKFLGSASKFALTLHHVLLYNTYSDRQIYGEISLCTVLCCFYSFMMCNFTVCFTHEYFSNVIYVYYIIRAGLSSRIVYLLTLLNCWDHFSLKIIYLVNPPFGP